MPDEDQGYLIGLVTLPLGASMQRTEAVADAFSKQMRAAAGGGRTTFAITGLNLLTGTNSSYAATIFTILQALGAAPRRRARRAGAGGARSTASASGIKEATVLTFNPPPIPGIGTAGGFEFILEDRGGGDIDKFAGVLGDFLGAGEQAAGAHAGVHAVQHPHPADRVRARSRARQDARCVDLEHLLHPADLLRRQLHQ